jgi:hypothetical protein
LWSSFEALCNFGENVDPSKYFTTTSALNVYNTQISSKMNSSNQFYNQENITCGSNSEFGKTINQSQDCNYYLNDLFTMKVSNLLW